MEGREMKLYGLWFVRIPIPEKRVREMAADERTAADYFRRCPWRRYRFWKTVVRKRNP